MVVVVVVQSNQRFVEQEGNVSFNDPLNTLIYGYMARTYGKGPLSERAARDL